MMNSSANGHHDLPGAKTPQHIAIVRALPGLGDFLCFVPALRALRQTFPQACISLIGLPATQPLVERFAHYVDELLPFPGFPGINETAVDGPKMLTFLNEVCGQFDLALQMHGNGIASNRFLTLLGAKRMAGFFLPGQYCPDTDTFLPYPSPESEIVRHLQLLARLGIPDQGTALEFPLHDTDLECLLELSETQVLEPGRYVCIHAGASAAARCWHPSCFAAVADELARLGLQIVLTGTADEKKRVEAVQQQMSFGAYNLCGRTTIGTLAALLSGACLLLSNDTGVSHLATALHTPSVVLFVNAAAAASWAPLDQTRHRAVTNVQPDRPTLTHVLTQAYELLQQETV